MQIGFTILRMVCVLVETIGEMNGSYSNQRLRMVCVNVEKLLKNNLL